MLSNFQFPSYDVWTWTSQDSMPICKDIQEIIFHKLSYSPIHKLNKTTSILSQLSIHITGLQQTKEQNGVTNIAVWKNRLEKNRGVAELMKWGSTDMRTALFCSCLKCIVPELSANKWGNYIEPNPSNNDHVVAKCEDLYRNFILKR